MFEKEAEEYLGNFADCANCKERWSGCADSLDEYCLVNDGCYATPKEQDIYIAGAEYGYKKALEEVKHDLMMKLKDDGIVKPLKDSIFRNERLSSQEQQELCAWIECAMDFGENLDKCAEQLTKAKDIIRDYKIVVEGDHTTVCSVPEENRCINVLKLNEQAEQFLNSEVEKKEND